MDISFPNQKKLQLEAAIMIYKQKSGYYSDGTYAAILHKIESNGRFLPGKNLDTNNETLKTDVSDDSNKYRFADL